MTFNFQRIGNRLCNFRKQQQISSRQPQRNRVLTFFQKLPQIKDTLHFCISRERLSSSRTDLRHGAEFYKHVGTIVSQSENKLENVMIHIKFANSFRTSY